MATHNLLLTLLLFISEYAAYPRNAKEEKEAITSKIITFIFIKRREE
jgi:hypothetical protein